MFRMGFWRNNGKMAFDATTIYKRLSNGEYVEGLSTLNTADIEKKLLELKQSLPGVEFEVFIMPQFVRLSFPDFYDGKIMNLFPDLMLDYGCPVYHESTGKRLDEHPFEKGENYYI